MSNEEFAERIERALKRAKTNAAGGEMADVEDGAPPCASGCGKTTAEMTEPERAMGGYFGDMVVALRDGLLPLFCSFACLERAKAAAVEKPRREPVAPWARSGGGQNCTTGFNWTTRQWDDESHYKGSVALYSRPAPHGGGGNQAVCEACAERAGVFGPVDAAVPDPPGPLYPTPKPSWPDRPTCAGSLATHGTPVLRVGRNMTVNCEVSAFHMCDSCWRYNERYCASETRKIDEPFLAPNPEPPARVGTVPQSIGPGAGIGIWASRGMR